jgi:uncharacterized protein YidB (DUF937 family)
MGTMDVIKRLYKKTESAAESAAAAAGKAVSAGVGNLQEKVIASRLLGEAGDKLSGLLDKLRSADLDDAVKSWVAKGKNKPVTPDQVTAALGEAEVKSVASDMGVSSEEAAGTIARLLPTIIDKLTPDGLVPDPKALAERMTGVFKR